MHQNTYPYRMIVVCKKKLKEIFLKASLIAKDNLADDSWQAIIKYEKQSIRIKLWAFSLISLTSFIVLIPVLKTMLSNFSQSGFYEYLSLVFSSGGLIISYWRDFLSSLAESLPVMSIALSLTLIVILFMSLKYVTREIIKGQLILS